VNLRPAQAEAMPEKPDRPTGVPPSRAQEPVKDDPLGGGAPAHPLEPMRYLAWLYSPPLKRAVLAALCEIEREIASSLRPGLDHHVAHTRLQWWREECERCAQGRPVHPMTRELVRAYGGPSTVAPRDALASLRAFSAPHGEKTETLGGGTGAGGENATASGDETDPPESSPLAGIMGFADTAVWDLAGATFETRRELTAYCERWAAAMIEPVVAHATPAGTTATSSPGHGVPTDVSLRHAIPTDEPATAAPRGGAPTDKSLKDAAPPGASSPSAVPAAVRWRAMGVALREIELLADLAREVHSGRLRVPLDELERAGVDPSSVNKPPWSAALCTLLRERHEALRSCLAENVAGLESREQADFRGILVWAALAWRLSWRAQRALPNPIVPRRYHALADGWHAWRAARRAMTGSFRLS
jgi:phytoene/squalene synthetase